MSEWIKCSERMPPWTEKGGDPAVIVYSPVLRKDPDFPGHPYIISNPQYVANGNATRDFGVTHWMPLPEPPHD